jgi:hypothetical protein
MKHPAGILILLALLPKILTAQAPPGVVIKTRLLTNVIARNPNIAVEKVLTNKYSLELEGIWVLHDRTTTGGERARSKYYDSKGFAASLSIRRYLEVKGAIPNGTYIAAFMRYNASTIEHVEKVYATTGFYKRTIDLYRSGPELGFLFGRQFFLFRKITSEINGGLGHYWNAEKQTLVAGTGDPDFVNGVYRTNRREVRSYLRLSIGYLIGKRM